MTDLRVVPWKRYGHDRLYVNLPTGEKAAWLDRTTGDLTVLLEAHRPAVLDALAPYLTAETDAGPVARREAPPKPPARPKRAVPPEPPVPPEPSARPKQSAPPRPSRSAKSPAPAPPVADLAVNRPGEALRAKIAEVRPGFWRSLLNALLNRPSEEDSWRKGLVGELAVAAELERLTRSGWRVLHSIPLPRDVDIDHLLIGPGGVFTINAKHHRGARIWVGDDAVRIGGRSYPYVRKARAEAHRASAALTRACGFPVPVEAVLAFVDAAALTVVPTLRDVRAMPHREAAALRHLSGAWDRAQVDAIHAAARTPTTWTRA